MMLVELLYFPFLLLLFHIILLASLTCRGLLSFDFFAFYIPPQRCTCRYAHHAVIRLSSQWLMEVYYANVCYDDDLVNVSLW